MFSSGTTGYYPNPTLTHDAPSYHGPYVCKGHPHINDTDKTSFNSQISSVFRHPGKKDLYIALADRWIPDPKLSLPYETSAAAFESICNPEAPRVDLSCLHMDIDTSVSRYVWLPIKFAGKRHISNGRMSGDLRILSNASKESVTMIRPEALAVECLEIDHHTEPLGFMLPALMVAWKVRGSTRGVLASRIRVWSGKEKFGTAARGNSIILVRYCDSATSAHGLSVAGDCSG